MHVFSVRIFIGTTIRGAFSRMAAAKRKGTLDPSSVSDNEIQDILNDMEAEYYEDNRSAVCKAVIQEATESHPIIYDRYDLCDLNRQGKLQSKFSLVMLRRSVNILNLILQTVQKQENTICYSSFALYWQAVPVK